MMAVVLRIMFYFYYKFRHYQLKKLTVYFTATIYPVLEKNFRNIKYH